MEREPYLEELRVAALCKLARRADIIIFRPQAEARLRRGGTIREHLRDLIANPPIPIKYSQPVIHAVERNQWTLHVFLLAWLTFFLWLWWPEEIWLLLTAAASSVFVIMSLIPGIRGK